MEAKTSNLMVLVIEDLQPLSHELEDLMRQNKFNSMAATSGGDALYKASEFFPDFVVMDVNNGDDIDGINAALHIHKFYDIPLIFLVTQNIKQKIKKVIDSKSVGYLTKPFKQQELIAMIKLAFYVHYIHYPNKKHR